MKLISMERVELYYRLFEPDIQATKVIADVTPAGFEPAIFRMKA